MNSSNAPAAFAGSLVRDDLTPDDGAAGHDPLGQPRTKWILNCLGMLSAYTMAGTLLVIVADFAIR